MKTFIKNLLEDRGGFIILISLLLLIMVFAPVVVGLLSAPPGQQFTGLKMPDEGDYWVFFSRIEQSRQGHVFHQYLYSTEVLPRVLFFPVWSIMGLVGKAFTLTSQQTFYFFQLILIPILVFSLYLLISQFVKEKIWRRITLTAVVFTTGSDWIFWPWFKEKFDWLGLDLNLPDAHVFSGAYHSPHIIFFLIFICWMFIALFRLEKTKQVKYSWLMGIFSALLFLSHPFQVIPVLGIMTVYYFYLIVIKKEFWLIRKLIPFIILNLLVGVYLFLLWNSFEVIKNWNQRNDVLSSLLSGFSLAVFLLSSYSIFALLALYKVYCLVKNKNAGNYIFLIIWAIVILLSLTLPIQWKGKMILGLSLPVTILGCLGLKVIWEKSRSYLTKNILIWLIILLTIPSSVYLIGHNIYNYKLASQTPETDFYLANDVVAGLSWLRRTPKNTIILSLPAYSMMVPAFSGRKIYAGFLYETLNYERKFDETIKFFEGELDHQFLKNKSIDYILVDNSLINFSREYLDLVFENQQVRVYKVNKLFGE